MNRIIFYNVQKKKKKINKQLSYVNKSIIVHTFL